MREGRRSIQKAARPGYARVKAFEKVWRHIQRLDLERIDQQTLAVVGVRETGAAECLAALRFLGIRSEDGSVTEAYAAVRTRDSQALAKVIDKAYSNLLRICPMPAESRDQLEAAMGAAYGLKQGRMSMAAAALFEWLYEQTGRPAIADLSAADKSQVMTPPHKASARRVGAPSVGVSQASLQDSPPIVFAISVTPQTSGAEMRAMVEQIRVAWGEIVSGVAKE